MKVCLLHNPRAGSAGQLDAIRDRLAARHAVTVRAGESGPDLGRRAAEAARDGFDLIAVAGGDGTVHAVVNGLGPDFPDTPLAVLPLGTGNDLCRTLAVPLDPAAAAALLDAPRVRAIDVARVEGGPSPYLVNAATGGFSGRVASDVTPELKQFWGPLAYLRGAAGTMADPPRYAVTFRFDGGPPVRLDVLNVVVANARTAAGGVPVAPRADPEDGRLDVIVVRAVAGVLDRAVVAARLMAGDYHKDENVLHRKVKRVEIASDRPMPFSFDGELAEGERFTFTAVRRAVRVAVGPGYRHDPRGGLRHRVFAAVAAVFRFARRVPAGLAVGLAVAVVLFALLARGVVGHQWDEANHAVYRTVREAAPGWDGFARGLTTLGGTVGVTLITTAAALGLLVRRRYLDAVTLVAAVLGCTLLELVLKSLFAIDRPNPVEAITAAGKYSFPSGHSIHAVGLYGCLAGLLIRVKPRSGWRWAVGIGLVALAAAVGWTRVYLGFHWATDVIGAWLAGGAWLACCLVARSRAGRSAIGQTRSPKPEARNKPESPDTQ